MERITIWSDDYEEIEARAEEYAADGYDYDNAIDIARNNNTDDLWHIRAFAKKAKCGRVICYGRIGRWNGPAFGYRVLQSLEEAFYTELDTVEWYVDEKGDLRAEGSHHDGSNYYLYREITCTEDELDDLEEGIYCSGSNEEAVIELLDKYTKPLGHIFENSLAA